MFGYRVMLYYTCYFILTPSFIVRLPHLPSPLSVPSEVFLHYKFTSIFPPLRQMEYLVETCLFSLSCFFEDGTLFIVQFMYLCTVSSHYRTFGINYIVKTLWFVGVPPSTVLYSDVYIRSQSSIPLNTLYDSSDTK